MKKNTRTYFVSMGIFVSMILLGCTTFATHDAYASYGNGGGWRGVGHSVQAPHMYRWREHVFGDMQELGAYIREYMRIWRELHGYTDEEDGVGDTRVVTYLPSDIASDRAVLRAYVYPGDEDSVELWFAYGETANTLDQKTSRVTVRENGMREKTITNLDRNTRYYYRAVVEAGGGKKYYGAIQSFRTDPLEEDEDDVPEAITHAVREIEDTRAEARGTVHMNEYRNGTVFFVYGTSRARVEAVVDDFETFADIDEDGARLEKVRVDADLDGSASYTTRLTDLNPDTRYYVAIGVAYEDGDDSIITLGLTQSFRTEE